MKEIIEYVIAVIIIVSIIPFYNMVISSYYTPVSQPVSENTVELYVEAVKYALHRAYLSGNYTVSINEVRELIDEWVEAYVGATVASQYRYYARIYSPITDISVNQTGRVILVKALYNMTLRGVAVSSDGLRGVSIGAGYASSYINNTYVYSLNYSNYPIQSFSAIVAVLESSNVKFVGYWFNDTVRVGAVVNAGQLSVVLDKSMMLQPVNIPQLGSTVNATVYYYTSIGIANYSRTNLYILRWIVFSGSTESCRNYNSTEVNYLATYTSFNATHNIFRLWFFKNEKVVNNCPEYEVPSGTYTYSIPIDFPVSNLLLVTLYDGQRAYPAPTYFTLQEIGYGPPPLDALKYSTWIQVGVFTYLVDIWVWRA